MWGSLGSVTQSADYIPQSELPSKEGEQRGEKNMEVMQQFVLDSMKYVKMQLIA